MNLRRLFTIWLFALTLLLGQTAAFAHAVSHLGGHDPDHVPGSTCELCVGQASMGGALPSAPLAALHASAQLAPAIDICRHSPQSSGPVPCARAPPHHAV